MKERFAHFYKTLKLIISFLLLFTLFQIIVKKPPTNFNLEHLKLLFSQKKIIQNENEIRNIEMEKDIAEFLNQSLYHQSIYLIYGEDCIGKSTALRYVLNNDSSIDYIIIHPLFNGIEKFANTLDLDVKELPRYSNNNSDFDKIIKTIKNSLMEYANYRKAQRLKKNALIIIENSNRIPDNQLILLKNIAREFVEKSVPIVFVFISTEGKKPEILMKNMSRMIICRVKEPSKQVAFEYFKKIGVNPLYFEKLENFTGGAFKYLIDIPLIDKSLNEKDFFKNVRTNVYGKITPEISKFIYSGKYPEILEISREILTHNSISVNKFHEIINNNVDRYQLYTNLFKRSDEIKKGKLFQVLWTKVHFQNRAVKNFMKKYLKKHSKLDLT